jgi:hypothetical protein
MVSVRKELISQLFLKEAIADLNALVAALIHLPEGSSELIFGNRLHDPYPACLEAVLEQ